LQIDWIDIGMFDKVYKVDLEVEFQLLVGKVFLLDISRYKLIKSFEEFCFVATIKALLNLLQHGLWCWLLLPLPFCRLYSRFAPLRQAMALRRTLGHFLFEHLGNPLVARCIQMLQNALIQLLERAIFGPLGLCLRSSRIGLARLRCAITASTSWLPYWLIPLVLALISRRWDLVI